MYRKSWRGERSLVCRGKRGTSVKSLKKKPRGKPRGFLEYFRISLFAANSERIVPRD
jgi:hypothetical protein